MSEPLNAAHVDWCRNLFATIRDGGSWGVPRSGLVYTKRGNALELTARMPIQPGMPLTERQLKAQQQRDFAITKRHFEAAGIPVVDKTEPKGKSQ